MKITFWRVVFVIVVAVGAWSAYLRFFRGLGASTHLSDQFPWGIWIGFDALCGIMLTAGGFTLMGAVYVFNIKEWRAIARPALVTAFLGYLLEAFALMFDLGKPWNIWHPLIMWNPRSVMFLVGWCVMLYLGIMALEFAPVVFERFRLERPLRILKLVSIPVVITGVVVAVVHQSALGSLYLIVPGKLHPLWYTPLMPVLFFVSALAAGLAMTIFESTMSARHLNHALEKPLLLSIGRVLLIVLIVYNILRVHDLFHTGSYRYALTGSYEANMFWLEIALTLVAPIGLLLIPKIRENPFSLYIVSIITVLGFVVNRLNVAVTGMEAASGVRYIPKWSEVSVTVMMVAFGIFWFAIAAKYLPIFTPEHERPADAPGLAKAA
ncbi:MAG TPA: Ni/Fe-hydrogenase cytochrome b subunit [Thermoanaerobaculia bacterium]|nr:Ni/Fe-hydrogenase cytochrome b subunit [Thermoanaerobaculia bacterium]